MTDPGRDAGRLRRCAPGHPRARTVARPPGAGGGTGSEIRSPGFRVPRSGLGGCEKIGDGRTKLDERSWLPSATGGSPDIRSPKSAPGIHPIANSQVSASPRRPGPPSIRNLENVNLDDACGTPPPRPGAIRALASARMRDSSSRGSGYLDAPAPGGSPGPGTGPVRFLELVLDLSVRSSPILILRIHCDPVWRLLKSRLASPGCPLDRGDAPSACDTATGPMGSPI
jgi:hypothetical protein